MAEEAQLRTKQRIRHAVDRVYFGHLTRIMAVMFGYYSFITVSHYFVLEAPARFPLMLVSAFTAVASAAIFLMVRFHVLRPSQSHSAFIIPGVLGMIAVYLHVYLTGEQLQLTNGVLALFGFSIITLLPAVFFSFFLLSVTLFLILLALVPGPYTAHLIFMFIAASALSVLCFVIRYRTLVQLERLLIINRMKNRRLIGLSKDLEVKMQEAKIAAEKAEAANLAKDVFLANTTHELKTPLTGVLGMMEYLDKMVLTPDQRYAVNAANFSAKTLLVIVDDLLDLSKLDSGKLDIQSLPFSPSIVVAHVCELLRPAASEKQLSLHLHKMMFEAPALIGDPVRIGQIILNFLDNAIKFTDEGGIEIILEVALADDDERNDDAKEAHLSIHVRDTGIGIRKEDWLRIFERFEHIDNSSTRSAGGVGLGLAVCQALATRMGGRIRVDSDPGKGSKFTLEMTLPVAEDIEAVDLGFVSRPNTLSVNRRPDMVRFLDESDPAPLSVDQKDVDSRPNILFAEDNLVNQMLVKKLAARFGWRLTIVGDGLEAVEKVRSKTPFDVILMDIRMPRLDGIEATKAIQALETAEFSAPPIIALTANAGDEEIAAYRAAGMADVVSKPINEIELQASVHRLLKAVQTTAKA